MATFSTDKRKLLSQKGQAMPDGGFPIRNASDLKNAIQSFGRANNKPAVKAWIIKRAKELNLENMLPDGWVGATHSAIDEVKAFIAHDAGFNSKTLASIYDSPAIALGASYAADILSEHV